MFILCLFYLINRIKKQRERGENITCKNMTLDRLETCKVKEIVKMFSTDSILRHTGPDFKLI